MVEITVDSLIRLGTAVICGGLIGANRDFYGKPTGMRAHALVALGAAILVIAGGDQPDPTSRVIQGVIAGIGFLGGGVILRGTKNLRVYHLVTAASLWVTTGVGVLCGLGAWKLGFVATGLVLVVLVLGVYLDRWLYGAGGVKTEDRE